MTQFNKIPLPQHEVGRLFGVAFQLGFDFATDMYVSMRLPRNGSPVNYGLRTERLIRYWWDRGRVDQLIETLSRSEDG